MGRRHSTGVLPPGSPFALFVLTPESYVKLRNVRTNPTAALVVTFPHRILTLQRYAHVLPQQQAEAVETLAAKVLGES